MEFPEHIFIFKIFLEEKHVMVSLDWVPDKGQESGMVWSGMTSENSGSSCLGTHIVCPKDMTIVRFQVPWEHLHLSCAL